MTPADFARSQGWRVGDVILGQYGLMMEITAISYERVLGFSLIFWVLGELDETSWLELEMRTGTCRRIGRVLRPNHTAAQSAKEGRDGNH